MITGFANRGTEDVFNGVDSGAARRACPQRLHSLARGKLEDIDSALELTDLSSTPGNRLEALRGDRDGQHSIRINNRYRICFVWNSGQAASVEITDYHR